MPEPGTIIAGLGLAKGIFDSIRGSRKSKSQRFFEKELNAEVDQDAFNKILGRIEGGARIDAKHRKSNLAARGLNPTGAIGRAESRAASGASANKVGAAASALAARAEMRRMRAAQALAGMEQDSGGGDLIGAITKYLLAKNSAKGLPGGADNNRFLDNQSPVDLNDISTYSGVA